MWASLPPISAAVKLLREGESTLTSMGLGLEDYSFVLEDCSCVKDWLSV